ncbi:MAG: PilZ domain-containing protein, partial [Myxococcales bacterium]
MEQERRTSGGQRVPFEALVVVASPKGGAGAYECEAVNLSENGMHLRTAYLPDNGQTLSFRFETGSGEVSLDGQVVWREEQARGGEFGVRFAPADEAALGTIRRALGLDEAPADAPADAAAPHRAARGSRVRLHIDGLNSPMRARVRDDHTGEVLVGSNLDFLKVGKPLELEDVDHGQRRCAVVDKVEVEVDPASKVPQLVVTLRYEDAGSPADEARQAAGVKSSEASAERAAARAALAASGAVEGSGAADAPVDGDDGLPAAAPSPFGKLRDAIGQAGARLPVLGASARVALGSLVERVRAKREQEQTDDAPTPRRVTAPAPDGGVSVMGGRRQQSSSAKEDAVDNGNGDSEHEELSGLEEADEESLKIRKKQRMMIAAGAGLLALLLVVFGVRARSSTPPGDLASAEAPAATLVATNALAPNGTLAGANLAAPGVLGSADAVSAHVPLFGTTPLTTT